MTDNLVRNVRTKRNVENMFAKALSFFNGTKWSKVIILKAVGTFI